MQITNASTGWQRQSDQCSCWLDWLQTTDCLGSACSRVGSLHAAGVQIYTSRSQLSVTDVHPRQNREPHEYFVTMQGERCACSHLASCCGSHCSASARDLSIRYDTSVPGVPTPSWQRYNFGRWVSLRSQCTTLSLGSCRPSANATLRLSRYLSIMKWR